ncbi:MAG TPA: 4a-hydroxytetrahydrobiopterin dehydratase [Solirubrobacteraceae bacterium]|jgi:4a-hydroxytetrahydrobiopterin dehydratase|nr:4a-hydroxytetrahydrobiopterin dehydratase [Solirubrobacteraceae bacterium]
METLDDQQIEAHLTGVDGWVRDGDAIVRDCKLSDFVAAIALVDAVAVVAEQANHHPDILVHGWNRVRLTLSTHSAGGLTGADFALAAEIDALLP